MLRHALFLLAMVVVASSTSNAVAQTPQPAWQKEWAKILDTAKKEGTVSLWGPPGVWARKVLVDEFEKSFPQVRVHYEGASGSAAWPKIQSERVDPLNRLAEGVRYYEQFTVTAVRQRNEVSTRLAREIIRD